ncbi:MAG: GH116 family glycosyl hydrolase [Synechococcales bacterium]|nr:GH116 family glycosyl hydrolase [Synechococcales bacterium]
MALAMDYGWQRPIGLGWEAPYTVRYASNLDDGPWHGMPLGGLGAGCVGRSPRGDFNLWHIDGGEHIFQSVPACQFSVFEQSADGSSRAYALCTEAPDTSLAAWRWYPASRPGAETDPSRSTGTYRALYPRSWFTYANVFRARLTCEQFSPIWANNYQESSYPVAVFEWRMQNPTAQPLTVSILLSWQNMVGWFTNANKSPEVRLRDDGSPVYEYRPRLGQSAGNVNRGVQGGGAIGLVMEGPPRSTPIPQEGEGQWAIATSTPDSPENPSTENNLKRDCFRYGRWNPAGDGSELWETFARDGSLPDWEDETPAAAAEQIAGAIAQRITLPPQAEAVIPFVIAWDLPVTEFAAGIQSYRRYTDFYGQTGQNAWAIATDALTHYPTWRQQIQNWQQPILDRSDLPPWFKMALFNELYDLTSGGSLWSAASDRDPVGQFAVLECFDYQWYESLDVRLYGSFALLMLFPELDKAVLRAFARAIPAADSRTRVIGYYQTIGAESPLAVRKVADATPHDLGAPNEHPWEKTNYTAYQDCNLWKDLAADFVLQVYRGFVWTGKTDDAFLADCWEAVVRALAYLKAFDQDGDGIPENSGAPDQTFDDWRLQGISAYCGGLWLAALEAAIAIGTRLIRVAQDGLGGGAGAVELPDVNEVEGAIATYQSWLQVARPLYHKTLWNGQYYRLDSDSGSDAVMADQLCGQFYARLLGLPDIVPMDCARSALQKIYDACFLKFHDGQFGAANGVRPDGSPVNPNDTHPLEVWTGINFGLAAFLVQMDMRQEALKLTEAVVRQIYENGLQFRTPEAITANGTFRACHYLRPMAIWLTYGVWVEL